MDIPSSYKDPIKLEKELRSEPEEMRIKRGESLALKLFRQMVKRVPAYHHFLKKEGFDFRKITSARYFHLIPLIDKDNYLRKYALEDLCWDGNLQNGRWTISATSGSTGEPFYFPRQKDQDWQYSVTAELYLRSNFDIDNKSTLYIIGWGMGIWIGGVFSYQAVKYLSERGNYNLSVITPGSSKYEIINAVKNLGHKFDQVIIGGYPPMVKDTIDEGITQGINWKDYNLKFIFSAEGFSEAFRDYLIEKAGLKNPYKDTLNHYGTVDMGTMAHETPLSILVRRLALNNPGLNGQLFHQKYRQPTLAQYDPELFYFEQQEGVLLCSAYSGLPLFRYNLKDTGGIITLREIIAIFKQNGIDLLTEAKKVHIEKTIWNLPFVYLFERNDFTVKLSGANIYPEEIKKAITCPALHDFLTGKFTMSVKYDKKLDQYLALNIELKKNIKLPKMVSRSVTDAVIKQLLTENSEYKYLYDHLPHRRLIPHVHFCTYEDPKYFSAIGKHKWVKN